MQTRSGIYYLYAFWSLAEFQGGFCIQERFSEETKKTESKNLRNQQSSFIVLRFGVYKWWLSWTFFLKSEFGPR